MKFNLIILGTTRVEWELTEGEVLERIQGLMFSGVGFAVEKFEGYPDAEDMVDPAPTRDLEMFWG